MVQQLLFLLLMTAIPCAMVCSTGKPPAKIVNVTVKQGETFTYNLGSFGVDEGASMYEQADFYTESEVKKNGAKLSYCYKPVVNFTGMDKVVIKTKKTGIGNDEGETEASINFNIKVVP